MDSEDLIDLNETESETSSSSHGGTFEAHQPFVLELHNIRKDDPLPAESVPQTGKIRKHKKKKKGLPAVDNSQSSVSSDSISEVSSVASPGSEVKEEFYDAHESYHGMAANPLTTGPAVAAAKLQAHSEHSQNPKTAGPAPEQQSTTTSTAVKQPSTITKPVNPPD